MHNGNLEITEEVGCLNFDKDSKTGDYYKIENGVRSELTKPEYLQKIDELSSVTFIKYRCNRFTKIAGFRFIPATESDNMRTSVPTADFSSYDKIIEMYKKIVGSFFEDTINDWINGKYDNLYVFEDNASYELFNSVFYSVISSCPYEKGYFTKASSNAKFAYGYSIKDFNGDGTDELILMLDDYSVIDVFTMKYNKVVYLTEKLYGSILISPDGSIR